jgi:ABC-type lipoprotein release transport system permease subunit
LFIKYYGESEKMKNLIQKLKAGISMRNNENGNVQLILMAVVAAIVLAVSIVIVYAVLGGIDYTAIDAKLPGTPCANASAALQSNLATFYSVSPIYIVVLAAVGIISAIMMIVITRKK